MLNMANEEVPRSIRFPKELWDVIDEDAKRCKRSAVKQLEALLTTYYGFESSEIDAEKVQILQNTNKPPMHKEVQKQDFGVIAKDGKKPDADDLKTIKKTLKENKKNKED